MWHMATTPAQHLASFLQGGRYGCVLADRPWRFEDRTGNAAP